MTITHMAMYLIGDVQGCDQALERLLDLIQFSPSRDTLYLLGDLVNRGPDNLAVLRRLRRYEHSAKCLLGNHDLHLLALHLGLGRLKPGDTIDDVLNAPDRAALMDWLRRQSMALFEGSVLMVHAGVLPEWTVQKTMALAHEVESVLQSDDWTDFITHMYGNVPNHWDDQLQGWDRWRVIVNALTRLRFCTPEGHMEFAHHRDASQAPPGYLPWFDAPNRLTQAHTVAFGHWSSLKPLHREDVIELDTGCVWGGCLSAVRLNPSTGEKKRWQVRCDGETAPV